MKRFLIIACGISTSDLLAFLKGQPYLGHIFAFLLFQCCDNFVVTLNVASPKQRIDSHFNKIWENCEGPRNTRDFWSKPDNSYNKIMPLFHPLPSVIRCFLDRYYSFLFGFFSSWPKWNLLTILRSLAVQKCLSSRAEPNLPFSCALFSVPVQVLAAGLLPTSTLAASPQICRGAMQHLTLGATTRGLAGCFPIKLFRKRSPIPVHWFHLWSMWV